MPSSLPQSSSAPHHQHPAALTSGWVEILLFPQRACHHHKAPSQEPRSGLDFRPGVALLSGCVQAEVVLPGDGGPFITGWMIRCGLQVDLSH